MDKVVGSFFDANKQKTHETTQNLLLLPPIQLEVNFDVYF